MKIKFLLFMLGLNALNFANSNTNITIFVHGTKSLSRLFIKYTDQDNQITNIKYIPKSCITHSICKTLTKSDPKNFSKNNFYVFGWPGKLSYQARLDAAKILYTEIKKLIQSLKQQNINPTITLITHSHGGNVALNLANCIQGDNIEFQINNLILLACPIQEKTSQLIDNAIFQNVYNIYSTLDLIQILDPQGIYKENRNQDVSLFSKRTFNSSPKLKQAKIKMNDRGVSHKKFLMPKFLNRLPNLMNKMQSIDCDAISWINIK